jgi:hypothetical protein
MDGRSCSPAWEVRIPGGPDNTTIDHFPDRSFNDAWLMQGVGGGRVAIGKDRHIWLGTAGRYLQSYGVRKREMGLARG